MFTNLYAIINWYTINSVSTLEDIMKKLVILASLMTAFVSTNAMAVFAPARTVNFVQVVDNGLALELDGANIYAGSACPNRFFISNTDLEYRNKTAAILTAYATGGTLLINYDNTVASCLTPVFNFAIQ